MKILFICIAGSLEYLQFRRFLEFSDKIDHCYTLKPLDFKVRNENKDKITYDYKKICNVLDLNFENIYVPHQTHSINVASVKEELPCIYGECFKDTDGLITNKKDKILSLTFADCICLYFYDPVKNVIANIHSGWKGTYGKISEIAVDSLEKEYGVKPKDLVCRNCT